MVTCMCKISSISSYSKQSHEQNDGDGDGGHDDLNQEVTLPHRSCKDDEAGATIVHPHRGRDEDCTQQKYGSVPYPDEVKVERSERHGRGRINLWGQCY